MKNSFIGYRLLVYSKKYGYRSIANWFKSSLAIGETITAKHTKGFHGGIYIGTTKSFVKEYVDSLSEMDFPTKVEAIIIKVKYDRKDILAIRKDPFSLKSGIDNNVSIARFTGGYDYKQCEVRVRKFVVVKVIHTGVKS